MLQGVILLWFIQTVASALFVAVDIRHTPESPVLKWAFVLLTLYAGPLGAFLYVLGCREPLAGLHERYVVATWRQVLGSTMHCVAGDGAGILVGAAIGAFLRLPSLAEAALEYALGFGFGWTIFQALFMRDMAGGSFRRSLRRTFLPELLSMNLLMAGMLPVAAAWRAGVPAASSALRAEFWFAMSVALMAGFLAAYPMNWWLVTRGLKHGMLTVHPDRHAPVPRPLPHGGSHAGHDERPAVRRGHKAPMPAPRVLPMILLSSAALAIGLVGAMALRR